MSHSAQSQVWHTAVGVSLHHSLGLLLRDSELRAPLQKWGEGSGVERKWGEEIEGEFPT